MLKKIAPDKWKHFYAGILMGVIVQIVASWLLANQPFLSTTITLLIVIIVSYGFELFSKITGLGRYDFMDAVASVIGGVAGMGIVWAVVWASHYYKI
jgi:glycopeptide antibiotics resistance protein